jgi:assimilatory nitrate reductase catalytic subunit
MSLPVWWVSIAGDAHIRYEVAGRGELAPMIAALESSLGGAIELDRLDYEDARTGTVRHAWLIEGRVELVTFFSQRPQLPERTWLGSLFEKRRIGDMERRALLSGVPASGTSDAGPIVCSCFGVGRRAISYAIASHALTTSQQVGQKLRAGTNCGSCVAEIRALLATATAAKG